MPNTSHQGRRTTLAKCSVASATVIEAGDMVYVAAGAVLPLLSQADNGGEEDNQAEVTINFAGVAQDASADGDTLDIMVETGLDVEYSFTVPSGTYRLGDNLGASEATGTTVASQVLEAR